MTIHSEEQFHAEKARLLAETEAADKRSEGLKTQLHELKLDTQFRTAYAEAGGIRTDDDLAAYEAVSGHLKTRMEIENGRPVFLDSDGLVELGQYGPKTLAEKMQELKSSSTFKGFFKDVAVTENQPAQDNQPQPGTYTRQQALKGKVSMRDIASGKAQIEGSIQPPTKSDTKVVSASDIAKSKGRRWN